MSRRIMQFAQKKFTIVLLVLSFAVFLFGIYRVVTYCKWRVSHFGAMERLMCAKPEHNFGTITQGDCPEHTFAIKNVGNCSVLIQKVVPGCGSCVDILDFSKKPLPPEATAQIRVALRTEGQSGSIRKAVLVKYNSSIQSDLVLYLIADVHLPSSVAPTYPTTTR